MNKRVLILMAVVCAVTGSLQADVLKLKSGAGVQGTLISANSREIVFLGSDGAAKTYPIGNVAGIDFLPLAPPPAPAPKPAPAPAAAPAAAVLTIPAGSQIAVRMIDSISGENTKENQRYRASIDEPVAVGSQVAIPRAATCTVQVVKVESGDELALRLFDVNVGGKVYTTYTEYATVEAEGTSKGRKAVRRGVGLGAAGAGIGALAGGGEGAAIGAAIGAGVGALSAAAAKGKTLNVPAESRLIFSLKAPLPMN